jgi:hypothetical protein
LLLFAEHFEGFVNHVAGVAYWPAFTFSVRSGRVISSFSFQQYSPGFPKIDPCFVAVFLKQVQQIAYPHLSLGKVIDNRHDLLD